MAKVEIYRSQYTGTDVDKALGKIANFNTDKFKETINFADDASSRMNAALKNPPDFFVDNNGHLIFHYDEYFEIKLAKGVWDEFTDALKKQWGGTAKQLPNKTDIPELLERKKSELGLSSDADYFNNVLHLRISESGTGPSDARPFNVGEFMEKSISPLREALFYSDRGKGAEFFNGSGSTMNKAPTWEEFQYLLLNYTTIYNGGSGGVMPSTSDCASYNTQKNYPWKWEKIYGGE